MTPFFNVREATVGCVAADCNPALKKHRWFDSNRVHHFQVSSFSGALSVEEGAIFGEVKLIADLTNNKLRVIPIDRSMKKIPVGA